MTLADDNLDDTNAALTTVTIVAAAVAVTAAPPAGAVVVVTDEIADIVLSSITVDVDDKDYNNVEVKLVFFDSATLFVFCSLKLSSFTRFLLEEES